MSILCLVLLVFVNLHVILAQETITPGTPVRWTLKESVKIPQKKCFTCPGLVKMGAVSSSFCGGCFGVWVPTGETNYCLHYKGPTQFDYDKAKEYKIPISCQNGTTLDSSEVIVKITPNSAPYFTKSTTISVVNGASTTITALEAADYDTEDVLTWTIQSNTYKSKFTIQKTSKTNANLNRLTDLSEVCEDEIVLRLIVSDGFNPPVGTTTVSITLENNTPQITSLNRELSWAENKVFYTYFRGPNVGGATGRCTITSDPAGFEKNLDTAGCYTTRYKNPYVISSKQGYDFEKEPSVNYTILYQKGKCPSKPVWLKVNLKNVNEKPELTMIKSEYTVQEGSIDFQPEYNPKEPDADDVLTYKLQNPTAASPFEIDAKTGRLYTSRYLSTGGAASIQREIEVYVADKLGLTSGPAKITVTIIDVNDNAPVLQAFQTTYYFQDCDDPGKIATLSATDVDPGVNGEVEFEEATSDTMSLAKNGELTLTKAPFHNQFDTINIRAVDKGEPVKHSETKQVSVIGLACPTTPPPYVPTTAPPPKPTTTALITTTLPTTTPGNDTTEAASSEPDDFYADPWNLVLLAMAGLLGLIAVIGALCFVIRCTRICCDSNANTVRPHKSNVVAEHNIPAPDYKTEKKPEGDEESGVFEEEEEVYEDRNNDKKSSGEYIMRRPSLYTHSREYSPVRLGGSPNELSGSPFTPYDSPIRSISSLMPQDVSKNLLSVPPRVWSVSRFQPPDSTTYSPGRSLNSFQDGASLLSLPYQDAPRRLSLQPPISSPVAEARRLSLTPFRPIPNPISPNFRHVITPTGSPVRPRAVIYSHPDEEP